MELKITIDDALFPEFVGAFAQRFGYLTEINDEPNPEAPEEFAQRQVKKFAIGIVNEFRKVEALKVFDYNKLSDDAITVESAA